MWLRCNAWFFAIKPRDQSVAQYSVCFACRLHVTCIFCLTDPGIYTALVAHDRLQEWFRGADIALSATLLMRMDQWSIFSLFCGQLSIFGSALGFKSKAFPNLGIKSRNCGQNMSVAVVACSSRLESVEWHDNALFRLSRRFSNRGLDLGNGTGTGKVAHDWLRGESGGDDITLLGC